MNRTSYWKSRADCYDELEWVRKKRFLNAFVKACCLRNDDVVLDVGTGTGIVARTIAPFVKKVFAVDTSKRMLVIAREKTNASNIVYKNDDAHKLEFPNNSFTRVTARMVFHHILTDREQGIKECYRVLKQSGLLIFSEGVPPTNECRTLYDKIFALKEKRVSFMPEEIKTLLERGGFVNIKMMPHWMRHVSTRKWLEDNNLPEPIVTKILSMHMNADENFKKAYNMRITEDDAIVDWKFIIATGLKL